MRRRRDPITQLLRSFGLSRASAERLARTGTIVVLPAGTPLCREGERGREAFVVLDGEAVVLLGDHTVTVGAGAVVGELAALDPRRVRNATVVARSEVRALVFDVRTFSSLADQPELRPILRPERLAA
jgi:CRP-like cAMP-binding protein